MLVASPFESFERDCQEFKIYWTRLCLYNITTEYFWQVCLCNLTLRAS